jgi:tripartite-type tricarboxylate transporter receptor subunit TctC
MSLSVSLSPNGPQFSRIAFGTWRILDDPQTSVVAGLVERLHAALREGLNQAEVRERLAQVGAETMISPTTEFRQFVRNDHERWGRLIRASGYKPED